MALRWCDATINRPTPDGQMNKTDSNGNGPAGDSLHKVSAVDNVGTTDVCVCVSVLKGKLSLNFAKSA